MGRIAMRISHGVLFAALLFVLCALLVARANWRSFRTDLASSSHVFAALEPAIPEAAIQRALRSVDQIPGVASVRLRDREADQQAFFSQEPWAEEYRQALRTHFLPAVVEITPTDPFAAVEELNELAEATRQIEGVGELIMPSAAQMRLHSIVPVVDSFFLSGVLAMVIIIFICGAPLESLRLKADEKTAAFGESLSFRLLERLMIGFVSTIIAASSALGIALAMKSDIPRSVIPSDGLLLIVLGMITPLTWAAILRFVHHPAPVRGFGASPAQVRAVYERNAEPGSASSSESLRTEHRP